MENKFVLIFLDLILPLALGYFFRSRHWLSDKFCNTMILVNILVLCTALSILSFWKLPITTELMWLPLFGILLSFIPGIAAYLISQNKYTSSLEKGSYLASAMLSNIGLLGGLCAFILFGEPGFAYTQIVALFQNLVFFLFCFPMAQYYGHQGRSEAGVCQKLTFSSLFLNRNQLPVVGLAIGLLFCISGIPRPQILDQLFTPLVHLSAWTALIPVGYSIRFTLMKQYYGSILDLLPIKFIVTPLIAYLIARCVFSDPILLGTIVILASVPTGINAIVIARLYHLNLHVSGAAFVLTTVMFLVVVYPLLLLWLTAV